MEPDIDSICARFAELEAERGALNKQLERLRAQRAQAMVSAGVSSITANSTAAEKVTLFARLFGGRTDVFPVRWENRNTGKSGYAPACANEWVRGVCGKPRVKCGECPNQAFISFSDNVIASHLRGADPGRSSTADFVAGVYPVRVDETCRLTTGRSMRSPIQRRVVCTRFPRRSSDLDLARVVTSGSFFRSRFQLEMHASWAPPC
jgi:hypothetical protein